MAEKSGYKIRSTKDSYKFTYYGDLSAVLIKARGDLQKEEKNPEVEQWRWIYGKAEKAIKAHEEKIRRLKAFVRCAEQHLDGGEADESGG